MTGPAPEHTQDRAEVGSRVRARLTEFLTRRAGEIAELGPELADPMRVLDDLSGGGKLLRPAFCYWGYRATGAADCPEIITAGAALELLHVSALIHDDVMDASDLRRGRPAAHRQFGQLHRHRRWNGAEQDFGRAAAILLGDLCLAWADDLLAEGALAAERGAAARAVFAAMRTEVIGGQYLDLIAQVARDDQGTDRALRVLRYKTAKYSVERPLQLGAALGGGAPELAAAFTAFGIPLGEAFQLRDDVLGVFGDPRHTGKPAGDDLREGKRTVLVARALAGADASERAVFDALLGNPDLDDDGIARLRDVLVRTGALDGVEALITTLAGQASEALDAAPIRDPEARAVLAELTIAATRRHR